MYTQSITNNYTSYSNVAQGGIVEHETKYFIYVTYDEHREWDEVCKVFLQSC